MVPNLDHMGRLQTKKFINFGQNSIILKRKNISSTSVVSGLHFHQETDNSGVKMKKNLRI